MDEKELIGLVKKGDFEAFSELVELYNRKIFSFAYYHLRNRADAEDITQEVFWRVFTYIKKFDEKRKFFSWLYTIEMNLIMTFLRKKKKYSKVGIDEEFVQNIAFDKKDHIRTEEKVVLFEAIEQLNEPDKSLVFLKYNEDWSIKEIAETFQLSEENVKIRLFRAKEKLSGLLGKEALI